MVQHCTLKGSIIFECRYNIMMLISRGYFGTPGCPIAYCVFFDRLSSRIPLGSNDRLVWDQLQD